MSDLPESDLTWSDPPKKTGGFAVIFCILLMFSLAKPPAAVGLEWYYFCHAQHGKFFKKTCTVCTGRYRTYSQSCCCGHSLVPQKRCSKTNEMLETLELILGTMTWHIVPNDKMSYQFKVSLQLWYLYTGKVRTTRYADANKKLRDSKASGTKQYSHVMSWNDHFILFLVRNYRQHHLESSDIFSQ